MQGISAYPEFFGWVHYRFLRPITGIRNDNRKAINLAVLIFIRNRRECVPFQKGSRRYLETIKGLHRAVFEMEADGMIGKDFRVDIAATKARPGEQGATGRNAEEPKVWRPDGV